MKVAMKIELGTLTHQCIFTSHKNHKSHKPHDLLNRPFKLLVEYVLFCG